MYTHDWCNPSSSLTSAFTQYFLFCASDGSLPRQEGWNVQPAPGNGIITQLRPFTCSRKKILQHSTASEPRQIRRSSSRLASSRLVCGPQTFHVLLRFGRLAHTCGPHASFLMRVLAKGVPPKPCVPCMRPWAFRHNAHAMLRPDIEAACVSAFSEKCFAKTPGRHARTRATACSCLVPWFPNKFL